MSSSVTKSDFSESFVKLRRNLEDYLEHSTNIARTYGESSALTQLTFTSIKNIPYVFFADKFENFDICHFFSSRASYLESGLMSVASVVHNFVMGLIYTIAVVVTLGTSKTLNHSFSKHWHHCGYAGICVAIASVGLVTPTWGAKLNFGIILYRFLPILRENYQSDAQTFKGPLLAAIKNFFISNRDLVDKLYKTQVAHTYRTVIKDELDKIQEKLDEAKEMKDIENLLWEIYKIWPILLLKDTGQKSQQKLIRHRIQSPAAHAHFENSKI